MVRRELLEKIAMVLVIALWLIMLSITIYGGVK